MRIALVGYGRMGRAVADEAARVGHEVTVRLRRAELEVGAEALVPMLTGADVAIEFSTAEQVARTAAAAAAAGVRLVVGTTGWRDDTAKALAAAADRVGVVHGPNFSPGVHVFFRLAREAARMAGLVGGYDASVYEVHHRHKRDRPSGTARRLADLVVEASPDKKEWVEGPPADTTNPTTLYVTSERTGEVPGTHSLGLEGRHDRLELRHDARSRVGFARGAIQAAEWVRDRTGLYTFEEVMDDLLNTELEE